ncbi:MAG TPA: ISL3 family transposase [Sedimentisphaerales bacterium]|nr:ISL3 family transposase [Sedimentisphaerales bacterium]
MGSSRLLGVWEGYRVGTIQRFEAGQKGPTAQVWIELEPQAGRGLICSQCGRRSDQVHDSHVRRVRDLPILEAQTHLLVRRRRVLCPDCGPKLERLNWLDRYARVTRRLAESVARLCALLPVRHVAGFYGLHWETVKQIDKEHLLETLGPVDLSGVEVIVLDEFAIQKGHRYATVIAEPYTKRVLWVGRGRGREDIRPFFELLGVEGRRKLQAAVMDMNGAYEQEVHFQCPLAQIVYDLFHVVAKYGREVLDRVRVDQANRLGHDKKARHVVKSARWLLLRNKGNLHRKADRIALRELLDANRPLMTVYVLKDDLKALWSYQYPKAARRFWKHWYSRAIRSRIEPLKTFARNLKPYLDGIIAHCRWPLHTSLLEGINNKIKVIKRMAYGFRDDEYFFLKIRAAFPGIP